MYAVIFKAEFDELDAEYAKTASRLRDIAIKNYGCSGFVSSTEGNFELAISYWPDRNAISAWKNDPEHREAQAKGKSKWYKSYTVQVAELVKEYGAC